MSLLRSVHKVKVANTINGEGIFSFYYSFTYHLMSFQCNVSCGEGVQTRLVTCMHKGRTIDSNLCEELDKPESELRCQRGKCPDPRDTYRTEKITNNRPEKIYRWLVGTWSAVSVNLIEIYF